MAQLLHTDEIISLLKLIMRERICVSIIHVLCLAVHNSHAPACSPKRVPLDALHIGSGGGIDADEIAYRDEKWHLHDQASFCCGGLGTPRRGITLKPRLGILDTHHNLFRQFNTERHALVAHYLQ